MYKEGFDHIKSPSIDVVPNTEGEFVQVWDAPFKTPGRNLLLTYQRSGTNVSDVTRFEYPEEGDFSRITINDTYRRYVYRNSPRDYRMEQILENGVILVSDQPKGLCIESIFTDSFNFEKLSPKGRKLGDRAIMKRQTENQEYYVSTFQVSIKFGTQLAFVRKYLGREVAEVWHYDFESVN